ncbi:hypothetical protein B0H19DRAFT_1262957 [Mycena capillaripes]|nr:hypothetical protein B0H19DRAFT_1262957 [Mycena capillaripes]
MFSKLIAFGAMALALVNAAPTSQNSLITVTCNINLNGAPVSNQVHSGGEIQSGLYRIFNGKLSDGISYNALRSDGADKPVFALTHEFPAPGTAWRVHVLGDFGRAVIFDDDLDLPLGFSKGQIAPLSDSVPETFYIEPSGDKFIIRTRDGKVWTPLPQSPEYERSTIVPRPQYWEEPGQTWIFEKYE